MNPYTGFAEVYDRFMDVPYDDWQASVQEVLNREEIRDGLLLELGCGTGQMTERLAQAGYDMIGVDNSEEMLGIARQIQLDQKEKKEQGELPPYPDILYLEQDMREFELYGTVRAVISVADTMNYLTDPEDFVQTLRLVNNYLDPKGIFLFDLKTVHSFRDVLGDATYAFQDEDASLIWENFYDEDEQMNEYDLTMFLQQENGLFEKQEETHLQRAYTKEEICQMVAEAGLELVSFADADTKGDWTEETERAYVLVREHGKNAEE